jgi:CRISPR-associated protein Cas5a/b/c
VSEVAREIATQPACWREAANRARAASGALPRPGERVAVVGCGTSLYVAQATAVLRESLGAGETDAFPASEFPVDRPYDLVLAISRSGTTTEVVRLLADLPGAGRSSAISAVDPSPVTGAAGDTVILEFADERSVVQTRFATSALTLLRASLGDDVETATREAELALSAELPAEPAAFEHFVFLGRGWSVGIANEAALKIREAAGAWAESYPAMEYRHGPISVAGPRTLVWVFGGGDPQLRAAIESTGARVVRPNLDPVASLVLAQRFAVGLAEHRGLDPDRPRHLTRSVVL